MRNPGKVSFLTTDFASNFSTLDIYISTRNLPHFLYQCREIHWRYIFLHMFIAYFSSILQWLEIIWCQFNDFETRDVTSKFSLTHQFREQPDNLGEPEPAPPRPRLPRACGPKTILVLPKFHSCFFDLHCVKLIKRKTFPILQTQDT